jgi:methylglutaconyl-CoA hydratase
MSRDILIEERHGKYILILTMNRPDRHHALNHELATALVEALDQAESDPSVRAVILTGSGTRSFCAGQDMLEQSGLEGKEGAPKSIAAYLAIDRFGNSFLPIIAAINGYCYGGGAALAISCDIRYAAKAATFRLPGAEYGLVVGAATLPRLVGSARAKELIFTARKFDAMEAEKWGLVNEVFTSDNLLSEVILVAEQIVKNSAVAVKESKRVIDAATIDPSVGQLEDEINRELRGSPDQAERFLKATRRVTGK